MSAVDFGAFVAELATQSGRAILPFFRALHATEDKSRGGVFDPVTEGDRARLPRRVGHGSQMWKEPRAIGLVQPIAHPGGNRLAIPGRKSPGQPRRNPDIESGI